MKPETRALVLAALTAAEEQLKGYYEDCRYMSGSELVADALEQVQAAKQALEEDA